MLLLKRNIIIAWDAILQNPLRSFLTILGVIFGVASVICLIAVGKGTQLQLLQQMKTIGANQLIIKTLQPTTPPPQNTQDTEIPQQQPFFPLDLAFTANLRKVLNPYLLSSLEQSREYEIHHQYKKAKIRLVGVEAPYFDITTLDRETGYSFTPKNYQNADAVCIIGYGIAAKLFSTKNPVGQFLQCGSNHLKVISVLKPKNVDKELAKEMSVMTSDQCIYIPFKTYQIRFSNNHIENPAIGQHKVVVKVRKSDHISAVVQTINKILKRLYPHQKFEIIIPDELIAQKQKTKELFGHVLAVIATISLIVGGVGVMNIMYANVSERYKEIGVRRVLGASQKDILYQFLLEAIMLCMVGATLGLAIGALICWAITLLTSIPTIITFWSVFVSCALVILVGVVFGLKPALKASKLEPIEAINN